VGYLGPDALSGVGQEMILLWRAEDFALYPALRAHAVDQMPVLLLAPEFLLPALALFKAVLRQLSARHLVDGPQEPPHALIGVALLLQMCQNVNVYGFDPPELVRAHISRLRSPSDCTIRRRLQ
jgi:hypothetical protein